MNFISFFTSLWTYRQYTIPAATLAIGIGIGMKIEDKLKVCVACPPSVVIDSNKHEDDIKKSDLVKIENLGAKDIKIKKYFPPPVNCPNVPLENRLAEETDIHQDPTKVSTNEKTEEKKTEDTKVKTTITPVPTVVLPRASLEWIPKVRPTFGTGSIAAGLRITEHWWVKGSIQPHESISPKDWDYGLGVQVTFW